MRATPERGAARRRSILLSLATLALGATTASAGSATRAWVSGKGVDQAGCGAPAAPCRSLQYTHDNIIAAGGEIDILDPAGYGAVTITKAVSIVNDGVGTAGIQSGAGGGAINVNAGPNDAVYLRGLSADGLHGQGQYGLQFNSGRSLTVTHCSFRHFSNGGIGITPSAGFARIVFSDTIASDNSFYGIIFAGQGTASFDSVLDHFTANSNGQIGVVVQDVLHTGTFSFTLSHVQADNNAFGGYFLGSIGGSTTITIDQSEADSNLEEGMETRDNVAVHLYRSEIANNVDGLVGNVFTSGDNHIDGNSQADVFYGASSLTAEPPQ